MANLYIFEAKTKTPTIEFIKEFSRNLPPRLSFSALADSFSSAITLANGYAPTLLPPSKSNVNINFDFVLGNLILPPRFIFRYVTENGTDLAILHYSTDQRDITAFVNLNNGRVIAYQLPD